MANNDPKWNSMQERVTTLAAAALVGFGIVVVVAAYFYKDFDYAKNLWALIGGMVGLAGGYMFGSNNTKPSEIEARVERTALSEGASTMQSRITELENAVQGFQRNEQRYQELISQSNIRSE